MIPQQTSTSVGPDADAASGDVPLEVERLLRQALAVRASDVHIEPLATGHELRLRVDGLLEPVGRVGAETGRGMVTRLMVLAQLLTYRQDVPQEGRLAFAAGIEAGQGAAKVISLRVSIMPTTHGLRAVIRMPAELTQPRTLQTLGLPAAVFDGLTKFAQCDGGMLLLTGPAGAGKTTTIYALLEHIAQVSPGLSMISLEDPVERDLPGVTQIEVSPFGTLTYAKALRSIVRQDPQVLMLGEVRDVDTASIAVQAALSGHRLISTLHAGTPAAAIARLLEMGIEPYQLGSALYGVVSQRLVRRREGANYRGRMPIAEMVVMNDAARRAVIQRQDAADLQRAFGEQQGYTSMRQIALHAVEQGLTDDAEVRRILGQDWMTHE